jgi:hypothetical protein
MATLAAGDVTTQMALWLKANVATDKDAHKGCKAALATATALSPTTDMSTLWTKWIAR